MKKVLVLISTILLLPLTVWSATYLEINDVTPPFDLSADEEQRFNDIYNRTQCLRQKRSKDVTELKRTFHNKIHGCLMGHLSVEADLPHQVRVGVFRESHRHNVIMRLTNINHSEDDQSDLRGLALKVIDERQDDRDRIIGQDFLMNDTRRHFASTPEEILEFVEHVNDGLLGKLWFAIKSPIRLWDIYNNQSDKPLSLLDREYHSRAPFQLGDNIIKYGVIPCEGVENGIHSNERSSTHLTVDLIKNAKNVDLCFEFWAYFYKDEETTPLKDYTVEWDSEKLKLAKLIFEKQTVLEPSDSLIDSNTTTCDQIDFSPWNTLQVHRPIGDINKARWFIYKASREKISKAPLCE